MPDAVTIAFGLVGGLGLFLYGMDLMARGLQKAAGDRLRRLLEILTSKPLIGVLVGAVATMIIQSSSATTVMVVGFVNAGLMTLRQAASVIMGANIGTTATALIVSLKLTALALPAIGVGFLLMMVSKRRVSQHLGQTILGFGLLFLGVDTMGTAVAPLSDNPLFISLLTSFGRNPLLGVLSGAVFTALIQSSSATTGLVVALASQGVIDLPASLAIVLGSNIGTCVTAMLASIGGQLNARRASITHLLFNSIGVVLALLFFRPFADLVADTHLLLERQVANAHIIFNVANTLLLLPLIGRFVSLVRRIVPGDDNAELTGPLYLDERLLGTPSIALGQATRELVRMGEIALSALDDVYYAFSHDTHERLEAAAEKEAQINRLEKAIVHYLIKIPQTSLSKEQSERLNALISLTSDIERIGDHTENIAELADERIEHRLPFSDEAAEELDDMYRHVYTVVEKAIDVLRTGRIAEVEAVLAEENDVDDLEKQLRRRHIERLNAGVCFPASGVIYLDLISNLERVADHANNIAEVLVGIKGEWVHVPVH